MDYANPEALVGTEWTAENLDAPGVRVIDATYFLPAAERGAEADVVVEQARGNPVGVGDEDDVAAENRDVAEGFGVAVEMLDARADAGPVGFDAGFDQLTKAGNLEAGRQNIVIDAAPHGGGDTDN